MRQAFRGLIILLLLSGPAWAQSLSIDSVSQPEGNAGTGQFDFTVILSSPSPLQVTVDWATEDATATVAGNDYIADTGTVVFAPHQTARTVTVFAIGDGFKEPDESFRVRLSNPVNASIGPVDVGNGTVENDDTIPGILVADDSTTEGNSGSTLIFFTLSLTAVHPVDVRVDFMTVDGTATVADDDYVSSSGTVTVPAGFLMATVDVLVVTDVIFENDEDFFLNLSNPVEAVILDGTAVGTILNDDTLHVSIDDVSMLERDSATTGFEFTVRLSNPSEVPASVDYLTRSLSASDSVDFLHASGSLGFPPGLLVLTIPVEVIGDTDFEIDETFAVDLLNPVTTSIADGTGLGTILNDDTACTPQPEPVTDLTVVPTNGGGELLFTWTDTSDSDSYVLDHNDEPSEPFSMAGVAASGTVGIVIATPAGDGYYLLAASNTSCGAGPRRLCSHDVCAEGSRLDSGCRLCAAAVCAVDSDCCTTGWDAACVAAVPSACGFTCQ